MVTRRPRLESRAPSELAVSPLPREETTPPVTKTNFVGCELWWRLRETTDCSDVPDGRPTGEHRNRFGAVAPAGCRGAFGHVRGVAARVARAGCQRSDEGRVGKE